MSFAATRSWPLLASVGVHAALATLLVASHAARRAPVVERTPVRDIWIGETLEVADPALRFAPGESTPHNDAEPPRTAPPSPTTVLQQSTRPTDARPVVQHASETADTLAQRIFAYQPKSSSQESKPEDDAPRVRSTAGAMPAEADGPRARGFAKAFTRALPPANTGDPIWGQLPLGPAGVVRVSVTVDEDGTIGESKVLDKPQKPPSYLARLVDRTLILLRGGHFALTNGGAGTETLRVEVTLSERPMESGPLALGFEAPSPGMPGRAYFQLATGRFVEAKVTIERKTSS